jgi:hypothetical protein
MAAVRSQLLDWYVYNLALMMHGFRFRDEAYLCYVPLALCNLN